MNDAGQFYTNRVLKDFKDKYDIAVCHSIANNWIN